MTKAKTSSFILTLPLKTEKFQEDKLNKKFEECRRIYNACIHELYKRYNHMKESKVYRQNCKYQGKDRNKIFNKINEQYGLTEYSLHEFVKSMSKYYNIDAMTTQKIATRAYDAFFKLLTHKANKIYYKPYGELNSIEGKTNKQGIRYRDGIVEFSKLKLKAIIKENDVYAKMALENRVKYCRIKREMIKGKTKYYIQLVLEGIPPMKISKDGEVKGQIGEGNVGIDIGTRTIAISSKYDVKLLELAPEIDNIENIKRVINRKLERSRRNSNPNKYNIDGTINIHNKHKWVKSNNYIKTQNKLKDIQRKQREIRKQSHNKLVNYILNLGDRVLVESMNYSGLQARSKNTTINKKTGKYNKKKRFGKSLANKAPSMFLTILDNKLKWNGTQLFKINTQKVKASQYNHFTDGCSKKELKDRWNNDIEIQRDLYSSFLIMNVKDNLEEIDRELCFKEFDNFKELHDKEIKRLIELKNNGVKLISSMGI